MPPDGQHPHGMVLAPSTLSFAVATLPAMSEPRARAAGIGALALGAAALAVTTGLATAALGIANWASFHNVADAANDLPSVVVGSKWRPASGGRD
jgi:hypothetical protein